MQDNNNDIVQNVILNYDTNANEVKAEVGGLSNEVDNLNTATETTEKTFTSFKAQLRQANQELIRVSQVYGETSREAVLAAQSVAELRDQMEFSRDLVDSFNPDQKFKALGAATQISATGISGVTSGMALFGDQSKDTEQTLLKVQAAMAFSDSISSLSDLGDQWRTLKTVIGASTAFTKANTAATALASVAQKAFTGSVNTTSVGFKVLRGAIIGTGIGALVVGVGLLITNFDKVKKAVLNLVPGLASVGDFIGSIVDKVTDFVGVTSDATRENDRLMKSAQNSLDLNKKYLAEHGSQLDEFTKQKIEAKNKYNEAIQEENADRIALAKELNRELSAIDKARQDEKDKKTKEEQDKINARNKEASDKRKAEADKLKKEAQDISDNAKKANEEIALTDEERLTQKYNSDIAKLRAQKVSTLEVETKYWNDLNDIKLKNQAIQYEIDAKNKAGQDALNEENAKNQLDVEAKVAEGKKAIQDATINNISAGINLISQLFGKNKAIQKGALIAESATGIAKIVINTQAADSADTAAAALMGPAGAGYLATKKVLNRVSAGLGIATNIAATAKALGALGGGSAGGGGASLPNGTTPKVGFQTSAENQISNTIKQSNENQPVVKAIVVANEVTTAQSLNRNKVVANSI